MRLTELWHQAGVGGDPAGLAVRVVRGQRTGLRDDHKWAAVVPRPRTRGAQAEEPLSVLQGQSGSVRDWLRGREPIGADEEGPWFDAGRDEQLGHGPRILGKAAVDVRFALGVHKDQVPDAPLLAARERSCEVQKPSSARAFMNAAWSST